MGAYRLPAPTHALCPGLSGEPLLVRTSQGCKHIRKHPGTFGLCAQTFKKHHPGKVAHDGAFTCLNPFDVGDYVHAADLDWVGDTPGQTYCFKKKECQPNLGGTV